jgi:hypothetical protein
MSDKKNLLQEYVATATNPEYGGDWSVIDSKFPEFEGMDKAVLQEYVATATNPEYGGDWDVINSKFPEFFPKGETNRQRFGRLIEGQKKKSEVSSSGSEIPSQLPSQSVSGASDKPKQPDYTTLSLADRRILEIDEKIARAEVERKKTLKAVERTSLSGMAGEPSIAREVQTKTTYEPTVRTGQYDYEITQLKRRKQEIEMFKAADNYMMSKGVDVAELTILEEDKNLSLALAERGGAVPTIDPRAQAYNERRAALEAVKIDAYMDYLKSVDSGRYTKIVELLTSQGAPIVQGFAGAEGLVSYLRENSPNRGIGYKDIVEGMGSVLVATKLPALGFLHDALYGASEKAAIERQVRDVIFEADRYYTNYLTEQTAQVAEAANYLPNEKKEALERVGTYQDRISDVAQKMERLRSDNPKLFSAERTKQFEALGQQSEQLNAAKMNVERLRAKLQENDSDMALAEQYTVAAQEYNERVAAFKGRVAELKQQGDGTVTSEYNRLLDEYNSNLESLRRDTDEIGSEFFLLADRYRELEGARQSQRMLRMDTPFDPVAFRDRMTEKDKQQRLMEAGTSVSGFVREAILRPFIEPILNTSKGAMAATPNILAEAIFGEDRGNDAIGRFYDALQESPSAHNMLPQIAEAGLTGSDNMPAWISAPAAISQGFGSVAEFTFSGVTGVRALKVAGVGAKSASKYGSKLGITFAGQSMMTDGLYREALALGIDRQEAAGLSLAMGTVLGYTETLLNDANMFSPLETEFRRRTFGELARNFSKGKGWTTNFVTRSMQASLAGLGEAGEEATAEIVEGVMKMGVNAMYDEQLYSFPEVEEILEAGAIGAITGYGMSVVGNMSGNSHPNNIATFLSVINDDAKLEAATHRLTGSLTTQEFGVFQRLVDEYKGVLDGFDVTALNDDQKAGVADAVINIRMMEERIKRSPTSDISEAQLRPKINALKDYINEALEVSVTPQEEVDTTVSQAEQTSLQTLDATGDQVMSESNLALTQEVEQVNREYDTYMTEAAGNETLTTEVSGALGAIERNESLEDTQADRAVSSIFNEIDRVNASNLSDAAKERITTALFDIAEQIDNYDFRAKIGTVEVAESVTVTDTRRNVAAQRAERYFEGQTATDASGNEVALTTDGDRVVVRSQDGSEVVFDTPSMSATDISMSEDGTLSSVTMQDRFGTTLTFTGEVALDLAIRARTLEVGEFPSQTFNEIVTREEQRLIEYRKTGEQRGEITPTQPQAREQGRADEAEVAEENRPAPQEQVADSADTGAAASVGAGDTANQGANVSSVQSFLDALDRAEQSLDNFRSGVVGMNVVFPVLVAKGAIRAARAAVTASMTLAQATQAGMQAAIDYMKASKWYGKLSDAQKVQAEAQLTNTITTGQPLSTRPTGALMQEFKDLKKLANTMLKEVGKGYGFLEEIGFNAITGVSNAVVGRMDAQYLADFVENATRLLEEVRTNPSNSVEYELNQIVQEFKQEAGRIYAENNLLDTDPENTKKDKYTEKVEEAANDIEAALLFIPDGNSIIDALVALYDRVEAEFSYGVREIAPKYLSDAIAILKDADASEIRDAFMQVYGFNFSDIDKSMSSASLLRDLQESAAILTSLAQGEKLPSNLQSLLTVSAAVQAYRQSADITEPRKMQKELTIALIERFGGTAAQGIKSIFTTSVYGRTALGRALQRGLKHLALHISTVDAARIITNAKYAQVKTNLENILSKVKYQHRTNKPTGISAKIARQFKTRPTEAFQQNAFTQDILNVIVSMIRIQQMVSTNQGFYQGNQAVIQTALDHWNKLKGDVRSKDGYSPYDISKNKSIQSVSRSETRHNDDLYEGIWFWMNENGYVNDGILDYVALGSMMSREEAAYFGALVEVYNETGQLVPLMSLSARNQPLEMFDNYSPTNYANRQTGSNAMANDGAMARDVMDGFTTAASSMEEFSVAGGVSQSQINPLTPSASHPKTNKTFDNPIIFSGLALALPHLRQAYADVNITPAVQYARKHLALTVAMHNDQEQSVQNSILRDVQFIENRVTEIFRPRVQQDYIEERPINKALDKIVREIGRFMMTRFLTGMVVTKPIADFFGTMIPAMFKYGSLRMMGGMSINNQGSTPRKLEVFYEKHGFQIVGRFGSETDQAAVSGFATGTTASSEELRQRSYGKYSLFGSIMGALKSVPKGSGRKDFLSAVFNASGLGAVKRASLGINASIVASPDYAISPAVLYSSLDITHRELTGRPFDINEWVDEDMNPRTLTDEQAEIIKELRMRGDRAVAEIAGESDPASVPRLTSKTGELPSMKLFKMITMPFMSWNVNNTVEAWQALGMVASGRSVSDKQNIVWGRDLGRGGAAARIAGANEFTGRVLGAVTYNGIAAYLIGTFGAMVFKLLRPMLWEAMRADDDDDETAREKLIRTVGEENRKIVEAYPNIVVRGILDVVYGGIPLSSVINPTTYFGENAIAPVKYDAEDIKYNRYLRITQGSPFGKTEGDEYNVWRVAKEVYRGKLSPKGALSALADQPIFAVLEPIDYLLWYKALSDEQLILQSELPSPMRAVALEAISGVMLNLPIHKMFADEEYRNQRAAQKQFEAIFKKISPSIQKELEENGMMQEFATPER